MITIIPAIDIIAGKCVRLEQGNYSLKKVYEEDPLSVARRFEDAGIRRLHLVDLDGAKSRHVENWNTLERIAGKTKLEVDFGGGIASDHDLQLVFDSGASMAVIGSIAVNDSDMFQDWLFAYGPKKIILGADVRNRKIAVTGWTDITTIELHDFVGEYKAMGVQQVLCTDISKDGMMAGSSVDLYRELIERYKGMQFIASGGVSSVAEIRTLNDSGVAGAIIGKALYEGLISLEELKEFL